MINRIKVSKTKEKFTIKGKNFKTYTKRYQTFLLSASLQASLKNIVSAMAGNVQVKGRGKIQQGKWRGGGKWEDKRPI